MTRRNLIRILAGAITGATKLLIPSAKARPALTHNPLPKYVQDVVKEHLEGGHDVIICPVRWRDPWMQIPGRFHFQDRL